MTPSSSPKPASSPPAVAPVPDPLQPSPNIPRPRTRRGLRARLAAAARWLHVYLSMLGLFALLFFSATGITLNHPTWFAGAFETTRQASGTLDPSWVQPPEPPNPNANPTASVHRLEVVEHLRAAHHLRGALASFTADDLECSVTFKGPGYSADAFIDRQTGAYQLTETILGPLALLNDLHKGRDSGPIWSAVIDVSAVLLILASLSGLVLLFYIKRRRTPGLTLASLATALLLALIRWAVP